MSPFGGCLIPPLRLGLSGELPGKFRKDPRNALRAFPGIPLKSTAGIPQALEYKAFEASRAFPEFSPLSTAGDASFFRSGSGQGPTELVMEFPAVRVFLNFWLFDRKKQHIWPFFKKTKKTLKNLHF